MKGKLLKVLSLAMAISLVASLAACGGKGEDETTTAADDTTVAGDVVPGDDATEADVTGEETPSGEETEPATEIVTDKSGHTQVVTQKPTQAPADPGTPGTAVKAPANAAEAMKLFNDSLGKTSISGKMTSVGLDTATAGQFDLKTVDGNVEPTFKSETIRKFNNKLFPLSNATLNSAKVQGNNVVMSFKLAPVNNVNAALGNNGFAYFVTQAEAKATVAAIIKKIGGAAEALQIQIKSIDSLALDGTLDVTIDGTTGKLVNATYKFKETLKGKAQAKIGPLPVSLSVNIVGSGTCTYTGK